MNDLHTRIESIFRSESGRILAGLIRTSRSFDRAEEALQDAYAAALSNWSAKGVPDNPAAWITAAAQRKIIDYARREQTRRSNEDQLLYEINTQAGFAKPEEETGSPCEDDRLRLIFTCCHPALNKEAQIALTLRTLGGLTTPEIARAFLVPEATMAQRVVRAKRKIQQAGIPYAVPTPSALPERLSAVQMVLYLIFNEGYAASCGDTLVRGDLCAEAIRLARTLCELMPDVPESLGLLALMLLHHSRRETRISADGELVPLEEQDRGRWNQEEIAEGLKLVEKALRLRNVGVYQLQAAIAALHAEARCAKDTDWRQIAALYRELVAMQPSTVIALNHAVAIAMSEGYEWGLAILDNFGSAEEMESYYLYHAARADLLRRLERRDDALTAYHAALALTTNAVERRFLQRRIREMG